MEKVKKQNKARTVQFSRFTMAALVLLGFVVLVSVSGCKKTRYKVDMSPAAIEETATATSAAVGQIAPTFVLVDQDGKSVNLRGLRGSWVVLYFYPKDDTPGCSCEATEFTELLSEFRQMNAKVYGINQDSLESHRKFREKYGLDLDLLSDPQANTMRSYGAYVDSQFGAMSSPRVIRTTFLIDPNGRVQSHWPEVIPEGHAERVKDKLKQLQTS